ncbi:MAG: RnfABCDGE type electron transport complex subunit D, partial [Candidatus Methanofishera endochildressiae]|nr:RnfABCDGE type electron transport complex subunit D [Candidatus Methanofishera endochildressiae]
ALGLNVPFYQRYGPFPDPLGIFVFGCLVGFLTVIIRLFGGLTEAVMYAILFGNAATPIIETYTQPRIYGARKKNKDKS